ncbi:hypothetical protein KHQ08_08725 [Pseudochrobactrum algeriensis]|uniref:hypothetical protein n=1 Tax=Pseudochrobactrum algeriensis TaxID=2834768 RepID=UPI001BCE97B3|nr:hypothetical protein [Pseudochrobactrum algeriensis]QVQ38596.1 hypothetical protein KHQ08_08725 [Pseudochrobactrum algeriensis]QVQ41810.1 hypothetical protein KHQ07_07025 [Pseudochrobactrum algeriensis]QVQ45740.1 hypothetical protein KHQ09_08985 [Pseudochrobactrum algeriensis]
MGKMTRFTEALVIDKVRHNLTTRIFYDLIITIALSAKETPLSTRNSLTPSMEEKYSDIKTQNERRMMLAIKKSLSDTYAQTANELKAAGIDEDAPPQDYYVALAHQQLFALLCGANPETFEGGDPQTAEFVIKNAQNIREHYWLKDTE